MSGSVPRNQNEPPQWNRTDRWYPRDSTIHAVFEAQVDRAPDAVAILYGSTTWSYRQLNTRANFIAAALIAAGVRPEDTVAVMLDRSAETVAAILGVLKAGGAYVPLSVNDPRPRLLALLAELGPRAIITTAGHSHSLPAGPARVFSIDELEGSLDPNPTVPVSGANLSYVMFSSGSTGTPNGVMVEHRSVLRLVLNTDYADFDATQTFLHFAPLAFDASTFEIWGALLNGARIAVMPAAFCSLREIGAEIRRAGVTTLWLTSGLFSAMVEQELDSLSHVRQLLTGGDVVSPVHARKFLDAVPHARLINGYGPTEGTTFTCCYTVPSAHPATEPIPIGAPIANTRVHILGPELQPLAPGETGEIYIAGDGVARQYLNRPELNQERFLSDPFSAEPDARLYRSGDLGRWRPDGSIEFLGRADSQVKLSGFRIEPGEIEETCKLHPAVAQACVIAHQPGGSAKQLAAFLVPAGTERPSEDAMRAFLAERLPAYMVPARIVLRESLPLTANGKINRAELAASLAVQPRRHISAPGLEAEIAALWSEILGHAVTDVDRGFLDLGGSSLQLMRVHAALEHRLARHIEIADLFRFATVRSLAAHLTGAAPAAQTASAPQARPRATGIAIVGMAGRFPGAGNISEFWDNLCNGVESITFFQPGELEAGDQPGAVRAKPVLDDAEMFDAAFFGIMPKEAEVIDPQQRVFLECCVAALDDAGCDRTRFDGNIGVFAGSSPNTYFLRNFGMDPAFIDQYTGSFQVGNYATMLGTSPDFLTTRVAYKLNLTGPAITVATACSTSLVAVTQACESLISGTSDAALAGGVSITYPQKRAYLYQEGGIVSPDGHCRAFDADAQGTIFGSGCGVVLLKRVEDAIAAGDHIYAVITGFGLNNDGSGKAGFTAPGVDGQAAAIRRAHQMAGVDPATITYVEAHGTGTPLGDPIEIAALTQAFGPAAGRQYCGVGSAKSNIGHLDAAAGVTGLIKAALSVEHGCLPPTLHYRQPNPRIDFANSPFYVVDRLTPWQPEQNPRRAGVSAFGVGGTNAHLVLEQAPAAPEAPPAELPQVLVLSARTPAALDRAAARLADHIERHPEADLARVAHTLQSGRTPLLHRRAVVASTREQAIATLRGGNPELSATGQASVQPALAFAFPGQGAQQAGAGRELYRTFAVFRAAVDECAELLRPHLDGDIRAFLLDETSTLERTIDVQPAMFVIEYALAELWESLGVHPAAMLGHSLGEFVAATRAGVFALADTLEIIALRARLMQDLPAGAMLAIRLSEDELRPLLPAAVSIAAVNAPASCVASGPEDAIAELIGALDAGQFSSRRLRTSHAFHSSMMDPVAGPLAACIAGKRIGVPSFPIVSTVTGDYLTAAQAADPQYWSRHCCDTVRFSAAVRRLQTDRPWVVLEVGPGQTLISLAQQHGSVPNPLRGIPSLGTAETTSLLLNLGRLFVAGLTPDWKTLHAGQDLRKLSLPAYPFERNRYCLEPKAAQYPTIEEPTFMSHPIEQTPMAPQAADRKPILRAQLVALFEDLSGLELAGTPADVSFLELGFDSLFLTQVSQRLEAKFSVKVRFAELLAELSSFELLTAHLDAVLPASAFQPAAPAPAPALAPPSAATATTPTAAVAFAVTAPEGSLERLLQEQLRIFSDLAAKQLDVLRGAPATVAAPAPSVALAPAPILAPTAPMPALTAEKPKYESFGPYKPVQKGTSGDLTPQQSAYLTNFIERYSCRTANSKSHTQQHRAVLADPRVASGFRAAWKEIVYPVVVARSAGSRLWDVDGNEYIDLLNGFGVTMFGHAPKFVCDAVNEQITRGFEIGPQTPLAGKVAQLLCELTGNDRATFCNTGSEAVMAAMRLARTVTGRDKIVFFTGDYHGAFDEVLVKRAGMNGTLPRSRPIAPGITLEQGANVIVLDYGTPESLEIIRAHANEIAAVMVEPVQSRHPNLQPREYLHELRRITEQSGAALIFDEVVTGFRSHLGGAQAIFDVRADLVTYGKVIGGGLPLGVVAGKSRFMDALDGGMWQYGDHSSPEVGVTFFAGTFVRHPLTMAATWAVLNHLKDAGPALQEDLSRLTARLTGALNDLFQQECVPTRIETFRSIFYFSFQHDQRFASLLYYHLRERGIHIQEGFPCFLTTAHTADDVDRVIEAFRGSIHDMQSGGLLPVPESRTAEPFECPLTEAQTEILLSARMGDEESCAFNEGFTIHLAGHLDQDALHAAVHQLIARHEALRSTLHECGDRMIVHPALDIPIPLTDLSSWSEDRQDAHIAELKDTDARTRFDLMQGPLIRMRLVRRAAESHVLFITAHHIVCDGWSTGILLDEFGKLYTARCLGQSAELPAPSPFSQYARLAGGKVEPAVESYWMSEYTEPALPLDLPLDRPRPALKSFRGDTCITTLNNDAVAAIRQAGAKRGCTLFSSLLSGFQVLLSRLSGQSDIIVGIPSAGQSGLDGGPLVGHCVNFLPLRLRIADGVPFAGLLQESRRKLLAAQEHGAYTYGTLVRQLALPRNPSRLPLIEVQFNLERTGAALTFHGLSATMDQNPKRFVNFDIFMNLVEGPSGITVYCDYNTDLFDEDTILRWIRQYESILLTAPAHMDQPVADLPMVAGASFSSTAAAIPDHCAHALFQQQAAANPAATALRMGPQTLTYAELDRRSNQLAHWLLAHGASPGSLIGISLEPSIEMVIAVLGVMKSGAAYLPLDPAYPAERLEYVRRDAQAALILDESNWPALDSLPANAPVAVSPSELAYVIYTSGSTGEPKGVEIEHRALTNFLCSMQREPGMTPADTLLAVTTLSFDIAGLELLLPLITGAQIVIAPPSATRNGVELAALLKSAGVTMMQATPTTWKMLLEAGWPGDPGLKMLCGGEELTRDLASRLVPVGASLWNMYGPTETTIWSATCRVESAASPISIGHPIANTSLHILDPRGNAVPEGVAGELYIGGAGLARGYRQRPDLTSTRFVTIRGERLYRTGDLVRLLGSGDLLFLGRLDRQVKIRGHRIELGDVEEALLACRGIRDSAVIVREDQPGDKRLVAYAVPAQAALDEAAIRTALAARLPGYMIPSHIVEVAALPLTANGKTDHLALRRLAPPATAHSSVYRPARSTTEIKLAAILQDVLGVSRVGLDDDIFSLGADSIHLFRIAARANQEQLSLTPKLLLQNPTVESAAAILEASGDSSAAPAIVPLKAGITAVSRDSFKKSGMAR